MDQGNLGKRLLYGFAGGLFGPAITFYVVGQFVANPPVWLWLLLPVVCIGSFWYGYKFPSRFEETFISAVAIEANQNPHQPRLGIQNIKRTDMQRKLPFWLGWGFALLALICFVLIFTRYTNIVPYLFFSGFFLFLILLPWFYYKNK